MLSTWINRWRRRRRRTEPTSGTGALAALVMGLAVVSVAHAGAMVWFEGMEAGDALWLTMTTMTTVGYGDLSAATPAGRIAAAALLYIGGIWILGKAVSDRDGQDVHRARRTVAHRVRQGERRTPRHHERDTIAREGTLMRPTQ